MTAAARFYYVQEPHALMRQEPMPLSTVVSDAIHSQKVQILDERNGWLKIATEDDGYVGWVKKRSIVELKEDFFAQAKKVGRIHRLKAHLYVETDTEKGPLFSLGFGSRFEVVNRAHPRWAMVELVSGQLVYIQKGDFSEEEAPMRLDEMVRFSHRFIGLPYAWGGRSSLDGYDCSGFVQMLYAQMGVQLPRDSKDQFIWKGFQEVPIEKAGPGDLVFWGKAQDQIRHVGMFVGEGRFIHSTVKENDPSIHLSELASAEWNGTSETLPFRAARRLA